MLRLQSLAGMRMGEVRTVRPCYLDRSDPGVLDGAWSALKAGGRLIANAVSIDSEARLIEWFQRHGGELVRLQASKAHKIGTVFAWRSATPVTQWRVRKP